MERARFVACSIGLLGLLAAGPSCGIRGVEGHYVGSVSGSLAFIGIPFAINGDISFDLMPAGEDLYDATGNLIVRRKSDGVITYEATLSGRYGGGSLSLAFTAKDGRSSGTMSATTLAGRCWNGGTWTISAVGTNGSGSWSACR